MDIFKSRFYGKENGVELAYDQMDRTLADICCSSVIGSASDL